MMIDNGVALSSTLSCFEVLPSTAEADPRDLEVMSGRHLNAYYSRQKRKKTKGKNWWFKDAWYTKEVEYDFQYYKMGGFVVSGSDPETHNLPGYGDQKNYEIFIKAGLKPEEAIQIMSANGAKLLDLEDLGTIQKGKTANLVILNGDLIQNPKIIREVETVFKDGIGYDPQKLINSIKESLGTENDDSMKYFGLKPPGIQPEVFAPNLISKPNRYEFGCAFSKDGKEFFFAEDNGQKNVIYQSRLIDGVWTQPKKLFQGNPYKHNDPILSPDQNRLYFISNRPLNGYGEGKDIDIWYAEREGDGWSDPINAGPNINNNLNQYFISFTNSGTMYFATKVDDGTDYNYDIVYSKLKNGKYQKPKTLPEAINTKRYEADVFVAPDESYVIFCSTRRTGLGRGDLYISFKDKNGKWAPAVNMGAPVNTPDYEFCPFVSADGKYLFYTSKKDIYWVSTEILEKYREKKD